MIVCALIVAVCIAIVAVLLLLLRKSRNSTKNKTHVGEVSDAQKSNNPDSSHIAADSVVIDGGVTGRHLINSSDCNLMGSECVRGSQIEFVAPSFNINSASSIQYGVEKLASPKKERYENE